MEPKQHGSFLEPHGTTKTVAHGPHTQPSLAACGLLDYCINLD